VTAREKKCAESNRKGKVPGGVNLHERGGPQDAAIFGGGGGQELKGKSLSICKSPKGDSSPLAGQDRKKQEMELGKARGSTNKGRSKRKKGKKFSGKGERPRGNGVIRIGSDRKGEIIIKKTPTKGPLNCEGDVARRGEGVEARYSMGISSDN